MNFIRLPSPIQRCQEPIAMGSWRCLHSSLIRSLFHERKWEKKEGHTLLLFFLGVGWVWGFAICDVFSTNLVQPPLRGHDFSYHTKVLANNQTNKQTISALFLLSLLSTRQSSTVLSEVPLKGLLKSGQLRSAQILI